MVARPCHLVLSFTDSPRLHLHPKARPVRRPRVDAFRPPGDLLLFGELVIDLFRAARRRKEHLAPGRVVVSEYEMGRAAAPAAVGNDGYLFGAGQGVDPAQLAQAAA